MFKHHCELTYNSLRFSFLEINTMRAASQEEPSDRKPDPWPLWMAGHAQWKFVMTEYCGSSNELLKQACKEMDAQQKWNSNSFIKNILKRKWLNVITLGTKL